MLNTCVLLIGLQIHIGSLKSRVAVMQSECHPGENGRIIRGLLYKETEGSEGWGPKETNLVGVVLRGDVSILSKSGTR